MTQLLFITLFVYSDMQRNTNLDLHKEITEMFLELSNVIIEAEQSLNKHLYLCTANRKKNMTVNIHSAHDGDKKKNKWSLTHLWVSHQLVLLGVFHWTVLITLFQCGYKKCYRL